VRVGWPTGACVFAAFGLARAPPRDAVVEQFRRRDDPLAAMLDRKMRAPRDDDIERATKRESTAD
jgi:hypothetical protein